VTPSLMAQVTSKYTGKLSGDSIKGKMELSATEPQSRDWKQTRAARARSESEVKKSEVRGQIRSRSEVDQSQKMRGQRYLLTSASDL